MFWWLIVYLRNELLRNEGDFKVEFQGNVLIALANFYNVFHLKTLAIKHTVSVFTSLIFAGCIGTLDLKIRCNG